MRKIWLLVGLITIFPSLLSNSVVLAYDWDENFEKDLSDWTIDKSSGCTIDIQTVTADKLSPVDGKNLLLWRPSDKTGQCHLSRPIEPPINSGKVSLWFYDNTEDVNNIMDIGVALKSSQEEMTWIAVRSGLNRNNYYLNLNQTEIDSNVPRSMGWHLFDFYIKDGQVTLAIDTIEMDPNCQMENFSSIKIFSGWDTPGAARFDGISIFSNPINISGIYPHLAVFGDSRNMLLGCCNETGIGAVVPWANKLWMITYPPHSWNGSADWLYSIDPNNNMDIVKYPNNTGGTHSARLIHQESSQLIIGPYFIKSDGTIRSIPASILPGRLTSVTRHLSDPVNKVYYYTMEQGLYEVDVNSLQVSELHKDGNKFLNQNTNNIPNPIVPGAHGKGAYAGQARLIIANNGKPPNNNDSSYQGGVLAEWKGNTDPNNPSSWSVVDLNKFTDVSGPNGINGFTSLNDPVWAIGWDSQSVILKLLDNNIWYTYRLPKASYTFDANHGWYTEWPRIHKIDDNASIIDAHGTLFNLSNTFSRSNSNGLSPISTHLSIVNSIVKFGNNIIMAGNEASWSNNYTQLVKPQSNLRFLVSEDLYNFGPPSGNGGPWYKTAVRADQPSVPYLFSDYDYKIVHFSHNKNQPVNITIELDVNGNNTWTFYKTHTIDSGGYSYFIFPPELKAQWIRFKSDKDVDQMSAYLRYESKPLTTDQTIFASISSPQQIGPRSQGILRPKDETLQYVADILDSQGNKVKTKYYEIGKSINIIPSDNSTEVTQILNDFSVKEAGFSVDSASVIIESNNVKYRFPKGNSVYNQPWLSNWPRLTRPVATDRNLMNLHGTFYELPYEDSGGIRRIRPITTHNKMIYDFASWRGLLVLSGTLNDAQQDGNYFKSSDNKIGLWFGSVEDLWKFGPPSGVGGPWSNSPVSAGQYSDPYLMAGYVNKSLQISHNSGSDIVFTIEVDYAGDGTWHKYQDLTVSSEQTSTHNFPPAFNAHWVRLKANSDTIATATFIYNPTCSHSNGDFNEDGLVNILDLIGWYNYYKKKEYNINVDFNCDQKINVSDLIVWYKKYQK